MLRVPSLKPKRLRGVCSAGVVDDVCRSRAGSSARAAVPKPMRARLRIACTATCGSSAQACTTRSPPLRSGPGRRRESAAGRPARPAAGGAARSGPCRRARRAPGPKPRVRVSRDGGRPSASPVSSGGALGDRRRRRPRRPRARGVIRSAAAVQRRSRSTRSALLSVVTSKAAMCRRSWTAVAMPAWWAPWNGTACRRRRPLRRRRAATRPATGAGRLHRPRARRHRGAEEPAPADVGHPATTTAAHLAQRLGQGVDGGRERSPLLLRNGGVGDEGVLAAIACR